MAATKFQANVHHGHEFGSVICNAIVYQILTATKINIEPENEGLEDEFPKFQGCIFRFHVSGVYMMIETLKLFLTLGAF